VFGEAGQVTGPKNFRLQRGSPILAAFATSSSQSGRLEPRWSFDGADCELQRLLKGEIDAFHGVR
jgi:hypothetical protein